MTESAGPTLELLHAKGDAQTIFHQQAVSVTRSRFGGTVFVRAVVEISNYCREDCVYCGMRRSNRGLHRFRAKLEQLEELLVHHRPSSVTDINIQAGEDPVAVRQVALPLIRTLRQQTNLGISVCLGILDYELYAEMKASGASL